MRKLDLRGIDACFVTLRCGAELPDQRLLLVVGLLRNTVVFSELAIALEIKLGDVELCLALRQLRTGLLQ